MTTTTNTITTTPTTNTLDDLCKESARHIQNCDYLLIATGAGFSADSNLPTYSDVAKNPVYQTQNIDYSDLCKTRCLVNYPALFYGFWASCFNAYQSSTPHSGYDILKQWCQGKDYYVYSSNVDGHFRRMGFPIDKLHEMHGAIDTWYEVDTKGKLVESPPIQLDTSYRFDVSDQLEVPPEQVFLDLKRIHQNNSPKFRPKVLLFDDGFDVHETMGLKASSDRYQAWEEHMETKLQNNDKLKLVVLEIGCGTRVPSVRRECQDVVADAAQRIQTNNCKERIVHIRINPQEFDIPNPPDGTTAIEIQGTALSTLQAIDRYIGKAAIRNEVGKD